MCCWGCGRFGLVLVFRFLVILRAMRVVMVDGGEGAEKEAGDVGEDGSTARRDAAFGEETVENAEGVVDALGPLEMEGLASKCFTKVHVAGRGLH